MATMNNTKAVMPSLVVLPQSEWEGVKNLLAEVKNALQAKSKAEIDAQWLESSEARKMLGVSAKTWQDYRDKRLITFSQFGRKPSPQCAPACPCRRCRFRHHYPWCPLPAPAYKPPE